MDKRLKHGIIYGMAILLVVIVSISGTIAYVSSQRVVDNVFKFGAINIKLNYGTEELELYPTSKIFYGEDSEGGENEITPPTFTVENYDANKDKLVPFYLRVKIILDAPENKINQQSLDKFLEFTKNEDHWDWDTTWTTEEAGASVAPYCYVYYKGSESGQNGKVSPADFKDKNSEPIFTALEMLAADSDGDGTPYLEGANAGLVIKLEAEAIQAEVDGKSFTDARDAFDQLVEGN